MIYQGMYDFWRNVHNLSRNVHVIVASNSDLIKLNISLGNYLSGRYFIYKYFK